MRWCCDREEIGCNATTPPPPPEMQQGDAVSTTAEYECNIGEDVMTWNVTKRVFCCVNHQLGCPTTPPPVPDPPLPDPAAPKVECSSECSFQGHLSTCSGHIQWAAQEWYANNSNACLTAFGLLLAHCPACHSCTIAKAGCQQPSQPPTTSLYPVVQQAPAVRHPPQVDTPEAAADEPPPGADAQPKADQDAKSEAGDGDADYNCDPDASDVDDWTILQRVYCCKEREVACPKPPGGSKKKAHQDDGPGTYRVISAGPLEALPVNKDYARTSATVGEVAMQQEVEVLEVAAELEDGRKRARIADPAGWITLLDTKPFFRYARKQPDTQANSSASTPEQQHTHSKTYECDAKLEEDWDSKQKEWCCKHKQVGCATTTEFEFNCVGAFSNWQQAWSDEKKKWCCENQGLGCAEEAARA
jgi:hypothetical protein